jgi:ribonuclease E
MLENERSNHETDNNDANGRTSGGTEPAANAPAPPAPVAPSAPAAPAAVFQAPQVLFQPPASAPAPASGRDSGGRDSGGRDSGGRDSGGRDSGGRDSGGRDSGSGPAQGSDEDAAGEPAAGAEGSRSGRGSRGSRGGRGSRGSRGGRDAAPDDDLFSAQAEESADAGQDADSGTDDQEEGAGGRRRRRRSGRGRGRAESASAEGTDAEGDGATRSAGPEVADSDSDSDSDTGDGASDEAAAGDEAEAGDLPGSGRRRRRKRRRGTSDSEGASPDDPPDTVVHVREPHSAADDVRAIKGSTRLEAKKQRRREGRESGRRRPPVVTESEFLARRESVERTMVVRQNGDRTQIAVLEDGVLVEHYVNRATHASYVGNVYLGKVQNVLPSMEAAFVDIGKGRNAVLYAGEVNFDASGLEGQPKRIESALKPGQSVIVQVTKDPVGHKGARLTSLVSLPGRYLVYVPGASMTGISRKLPDTERNRLKLILKKVTPENAGVIVRTAAEGAAEAELDRDVTRLAAQWENIEKKAKTATAPALLYGEPDLTIRVVRDVFNEDFNKLIVSGDDGWDTIDEYVRYVAPHLADRLSRWEDTAESADDDVFAAYRVDEQLAKALERKVWLPSGGSLVIDRTEAMTVVDVNTGKFTGQGGNLEETVTRNNLEAAEEIVRQLRLRDVGGIVVIDFIDMVLESNRELVLRRLLECLARDRTKHQVAEVTSLGLVQMTRKRVGAGLLEAFSQPCECCNGRGVVITLDQPEPGHRSTAGHREPRRPGNGNGNDNGRDAKDGRRDNGRGNGAGRGTQERQGREEREEAANDAETAAAEAPQAAESRESGGGGGGGGGGRRRRRDGRTTTNGGTASASLVTVAETAPVATPVTVADAVPAFVTPPATDAPPADGGAPVRRTRAGSAMARLAAPAEQPATVPAPEQSPVTEWAAPSAGTPATDPAPAADPAPADAPAAVADPAAADAPAAVADPASVADVTPETDQAPLADSAPVAVAAPLADQAYAADQTPQPVGTVAEAGPAPTAHPAPPATDEAALAAVAPPAADPVPLADTLVTPAPLAADPVPLADVAPAEGDPAAEQGDGTPQE